MGAWLRLHIWTGEHVLSSCFSPADFSDWILNCRECWARTSWAAILADSRLAELDGVPVWVPVEINVCDTHCDGGNVYMPSGFDVVTVCLRTRGIRVLEL